MALARCWWRSRRSGRTASARRWASTAAAGWRRWHDLPGEGEPGRDNDQHPVRGAHCEGTSVGFLKDAQHIGDGRAVTWCGPAPADHDPMADIETSLLLVSKWLAGLSSILASAGWS
jgi:hypothetical protein